MVEPWRVAQLVVDRGPGRDGSRGSGYLVAPGRVLTAAHVVAGAAAVRVRLDVGQATEVDVQAESWWADPQGPGGTDLAVVTIPEDATAGRGCEPARFGRIGDCTAVLKVQAFGFPLFKLRDGPADANRPGVFRDFEQVAGHAPVAANRRQGTLAVYLDDPPPERPAAGEPSPWEGMSGGSVWAGGRIVAVAAEHHPREGAGRLTARRLDRAYGLLPTPDLAGLVGLLGLAPAAGGLPDVVPAEWRQLVWSAYLAQVADIAPDELIGRESELAEWAEFCAGADTYAWWVAGPWAGKTALASWFVTHPPAGVDVVSFFITGRLLGQADSDAFLDAMIEQLCALDQAGGEYPSVAGARAGAWLDALRSVAAQREERGRRLVVVVDGLDEDDAGATPSRGRPSIASLLPRRAPPGVRVIVTSRPGPGLPDDVPFDHPLRAHYPRPMLVSQAAKGIELRAKQELGNLLAGNQVAIDVVGYIAGSGGGLTGGDLSALTGAPPYKLDRVLLGMFGRSLETRASTDPRTLQADPATRVYLFAHETLRATAEEQLGDDLAQYRQNIHKWVRSYADDGWPDTTPGYAIRGYPHLLTATADITRLSALARNPRRHAFLLWATGSDDLALTEIGTVQSLIADQGIPNLRALLELAVYRHAISIRNQSIPADLPIFWARLAHFDHAEALARTISPYAQRRVPAGLVTAIAQGGDPGRAEALAGSISDPGAQVEALSGLAEVAAQAADPDRAYRLITDAEALARIIPTPSVQVEALSGLAEVAAQAGDPDRAYRLITDAEALVRNLPAPGTQVESPSGLAVAVGLSAHAWLSSFTKVAARAGDPDRAEVLARTIPDSGVQASVLSRLAEVAAQAGDAHGACRLIADAEVLARAIPDFGAQAEALSELVKVAAQAGNSERAHRLTAAAVALARAIPDHGAQAWALSRLVKVAAQSGDPDGAEVLARTISDPGAHAQALAWLVTVAARALDSDRAYRLAADAEVLARTITGPRGASSIPTTLIRAQVFDTLATGIALVGDFDRAEALARAIPDGYTQVRALSGLSTRIAQAGDPDRAEVLARTISSTYVQDQALSALAIEIAPRDPGRAEALARTLADPGAQASALAQLATAIAPGDPGRAGRLATDAEVLARTFIYPEAKAMVFSWLAIGIAQAGDLDRADALARAITHPDTRTHTFARLVEIAARAGDPGRAETFARADSRGEAEALSWLAIEFAQAGDPDRAEALARSVEPGALIPYGRARALSGLVKVAAQAGDSDRAYRLAAEAEALAGPIVGPRARALSGLVKVAAQAGDSDRAYRLAAEAETLARTIADPSERANVLSELATVIAQGGDPGRAEVLARAVTDPYVQAYVLSGLAKVAAQAGDLDRAEMLAGTITHPYTKARLLSKLVIEIAQREPDRAQALARSISDPSVQVEALSGLVRVAAQAGDLNRADRLAADAEALARTITHAEPQIRAYSEVAAAMARAGNLDHAVRLLARALTLVTFSGDPQLIEPPEILVNVLSHLYPSIIRDTWDILVSAYTIAA